MTEILGEHIFRTRVSRHLIGELRAVDYDGKLLDNEPGVAAAVIGRGFTSAAARLAVALREHVAGIQGACAGGATSIRGCGSARAESARLRVP